MSHSILHLTDRVLKDKFVYGAVISVLASGYRYSPGDAVLNIVYMHIKKCRRNNTALGYTSNHLTMSGEDSRELNLLCSA